MNETHVCVVLNLHDGSVNPLDRVPVNEVARLIAAYADGRGQLVLTGTNGIITRYRACDITSVTVSRVPWAVSDDSDRT